METVQLLRDQLRQAAWFIENLMEQVTPEQAHWLPPGVANPLGATYVHVVMGEDAFTSGMLIGGAPLFADAWAGRLGVSELPPPPFPPVVWAPWGRRVQVDLPAFRAYAQAVYDRTDQHLATLTAADLARTVDLGPSGFGQQSVAWLVSNAMLGHRMSHWGELVCLRGLQGERGYPV